MYSRGSKQFRYLKGNVLFTDTCVGITVTGKHISFKALENFKLEFENHKIMSDYCSP